MPRIATPSSLARVAIPVLVPKGYALAGDFEGVFTLALGLSGPASIRIGELPGHWYIDVKPQSHGPA